MISTVKEFKKDYIRSIIKNLASQQAYIVERFPVSNKAGKLKAISKIRKELDYCTNSDLQAHFRMVVRLESYLQTLYPSDRSKLHTWKVRIEEIIIFSKNQLSQCQ